MTGKTPPVKDFSLQAWVDRARAITLPSVVTVLRGVETGSLGARRARTGVNWIADGQSGPYSHWTGNVAEKAWIRVESLRAREEPQNKSGISPFATLRVTPVPSH